MNTGNPNDNNKSMEQTRETPISWLIRVIKGALIGIGAILPGLSGGVLMVVFGIYDSLISFLGNFPKNFKKHFFFLLPVSFFLPGWYQPLSASLLHSLSAFS